MRILLILSLMVACSFGKPNVVLFVIDDLGADSSPPYGCETISTPTIDSLATDGVRLLNMHSTATCAPSRAMLLTGRLPVRNGVTTTSSDSNISSSEYGFTQRLNEHGIKVGWFGKWNLWGSGNEFATQAEQLEYYGIVDQYTYKGNLPAYGDSSSNETFEPWITMTNVIDFIEQNTNETFVCVWALRLPHRPYNGTPADQTIYPTSLENLQVYMDYADWSISNVLHTLEVNGLMDNTVVMYAGDNGTDNFVTNTFNGQSVQGSKGTQDENATWVPFYIKWDGNIPSGVVESNIWSYADIPVTILDLYNLEFPGDRIIDGLSFLDHLYSPMYGRREYVLTETEVDGSCRSDTVKVVDDNGTFVVYDITDKPFGDILVSEPTPSQEAAYLWMPQVYSNSLYKAYGDRPWGGSTNDYLLWSMP